MKKVSSIFLMACLALSLTVVTPPEAAWAKSKDRLTDISQHWAKENITKLVNLEIIKGYSDRTFKPNNKVTRAEFLAIFVKAAEPELSSNPQAGHFSDVKQADWFYQAVNTAVSRQIVLAADYNGKLAPNTGITRKEVARILVRGLELKSQAKLPAGQAGFADLQGLDEELQAFIGKANQVQIMSGYTEGGKKLFKPENTLTRAEAATVMAKFMAYVDKQLLQKYIIGKVNIDRQMKDVQYLSGDELKGRLFGSPEEKTAAAYIENSFKNSSLKPFKALGLDGYTQTFSMRNMEDGKTYESANVIGMIEGATQKDQYVILAAHYDHIGTNQKGEVYNGADDNAAGVSALMEIARVFNEAGLPPKKNIVFVAFSGEEEGSLGSYYFVKQLIENGLGANMQVINIEVIGAAKGDYLEIFTENLGKLATVESLKQSAALQGIKTQVADDLDPGSDAYAFMDSAIPAFSVDWAWSEENHPYYHSVDDDYANVNKDNVQKATQAISGAALLLAGVSW